MPKSDIKQLPLRLPSDIAERLRAHAEKNGLSMNETVVRALERYTAEGTQGIASGSRSREAVTPPANPAAPSSSESYRCPSGCMGSASVTNPSLRCVRCNSKVVPV